MGHVECGLCVCVCVHTHMHLYMFVGYWWVHMLCMCGRTRICVGCVCTCLYIWGLGVHMFMDMMCACVGVYACVHLWGMGCRYVHMFMHIHVAHVCARAYGVCTGVCTCGVQVSCTCVHLCGVWVYMDHGLRLPHRTLLPAASPGDNRTLLLLLKPVWEQPHPGSLTPARLTSDQMAEGAGRAGSGSQ